MAAVEMPIQNYYADMAFIRCAHFGFLKIFHKRLQIVRREVVTGEKRKRGFL